MKSIFVQIASYRDPQLVPTIRDLISNAKHPENLKICIAHQHDVKKDGWDNLNEFKNDDRFIIIDIPHYESQGTCWARNQIQQHYNEEDFTLQLDSHHRFVKDWDIKCIDMFYQVQTPADPKPILTSYIPSYNPNNDPEDREQIPWGMRFDKFTDEGIMFFLPYHLNREDKPIPARFYSAHFAFTVGEFCKEVPHDPYLYFHGEEITIAARAYTHGYSLFHPHRVLAWHEYTRNYREKHWDDHPNWTTLNQNSIKRVKALLGIDNIKCTPCVENQLKGYGLGNKRTLQDYENYIGVRFINRSVQQSTVDNELPMIRFEPFHISTVLNIKFKRSDFKHKEYQFIALIFQDAYGKELYRYDYQENEIKDWGDVSLDIKYIGQSPSKWLMWGYTKENGWADSIHRSFNKH